MKTDNILNGDINWSRMQEIFEVENERQEKWPYFVGHVLDWDL